MDLMFKDGGLGIVMYMSNGIGERNRKVRFLSCNIPDFSLCLRRVTIHSTP
jgi:hypothetical protein